MEYIVIAEDPFITQSHTSFGEPVFVRDVTYPLNDGWNKIKIQKGEYWKGRFVERVSRYNRNYLLFYLVTPNPQPVSRNSHLFNFYHFIINYFNDFLYDSVRYGEKFLYV